MTHGSAALKAPSHTQEAALAGVREEMGAVEGMFVARVGMPGGKVPTPCLWIVARVRGWAAATRLRENEHRWPLQLSYSSCYKIPARAK